MSTSFSLLGFEILGFGKLVIRWELGMRGESEFMRLRTADGSAGQAVNKAFK